MSLSSSRARADASVFSRIIASSIDRRAYNVRYRQKQLHLLHDFLCQNAATLYELITKAAGYTRNDSMLEFAQTMTSIKAVYDQLDFDEDLESEYAVSRKQSNLSHRSPHGVVIIRPNARHLFFSVFSSLAAALGAGNCVIVEMADKTNDLGAYLRNAFTALDQDAFVLVSEVADEALFSQCYLVDHTTSASEPVISVVDRTAKVTQAAETLSSAHRLFNGDSTHAPNFIIVNEWILEEFITVYIQRMTNAKEPPSSLNGLLPTPGSKPPKPRITLLEATNLTVIFEESPKNSRIPRGTVIITAATGLIDMITKAQEKGPFAAAYCFGDAPTAKFAHQYVDARITCINEIPISILISPSQPIAPWGLTNPDIPYNLEFMSKPTPVLQQISYDPWPRLTEMDTHSPNGRSTGVKTHEISKIEIQALKPLDSIKQHSGSGAGFFDQGIMTGFFGIVFPSLVVFGWCGFKLTTFLAHRWQFIAESTS